MGFDRDAYATRIKSLRKKSGLTQEQLAEKTPKNSLLKK